MHTIPETNPCMWFALRYGFNLKESNKIPIDRKQSDIRSTECRPVLLRNRTPLRSTECRRILLCSRTWRAC